MARRITAHWWNHVNLRFHVRNIISNMLAGLWDSSEASDG